MPHCHTKKPPLASWQGTRDGISSDIPRDMPMCWSWPWRHSPLTHTEQLCLCCDHSSCAVCDHPTLDFLSPAHPTPPCCFFSMVSPTMLMIYASSSIRIVKPTLDFLLPCFPCSVVWCVLSPLAMVLPPPLVTIVSSPRSSSVLTGILSRHRGSSHVMSLLASVTCLPSS